MGELSIFDKLDREDINRELENENPDYGYLHIVGYFDKTIQDILEYDSIIINKKHFLENMFQMIDNGNVNDELGIGESENKFNKKVLNFISKSDNDLLKLGFTENDIIKIRLRTDKKKFINNVLELLSLNPYELKGNTIVYYLYNISDNKKMELGFEMTDLDILHGVFKRAIKKY